MTSKPSIIMIMLDTLRADCAPGAPPSPHLRSEGLERPELPTLTSLVRGAVHFTQAIACAPYTSACHGSLFTGLLPPENGVRTFTTASLNPEVRTLAQILRDAGYETCAMSDQPRVLDIADLLRGFKTVTTAEEEALYWWDTFADKPRFLFLHFWDLHKPYGMSMSHKRRAADVIIVDQWRRRLEEAGIPLPTSNAYLDPDEQRQFVYHMQNAWEAARGFKAGLQVYLEGLVTFDQGRLADFAAALNERGIPEHAIMVVTADHGEGRDVPPSPRLVHGTMLWDDQIRIPLYIKAPGISPTVVGMQVSQADITPTLLDMVGLVAERTAPRVPWSGRSLLPILEGKSLPQQPAYAEVWSLPGMDSAHRNEPPIIRWRILRYPERKYQLLGKPLTLKENLLFSPAEILRYHAQCRLRGERQPWPLTVPQELRHMPKDQFLKTLYEDMKARKPTEADLAAWRGLADNPGEPRRLAVIKSFEAADEARRTKFSMFDLQHDPLEQHPIDARRSFGDPAEYRRHLRMMMEIEAAARQGGPLRTGTSDEQAIQQHLRDLGYVE